MRRSGNQQRLERTPSKESTSGRFSGQLVHRIVVSVVSCLTTLVGLGVVVLSAEQLDPVAKSAATESDYFIVLSLSLIIGAGILMVIVGLIGCYGAANNDNKCLIGLFAVSMAILVALDVTAVVYSDAFLAEALRMHSTNSSKALERALINWTRIAVNVLIALGVFQALAFISSLVLCYKLRRAASLLNSP